MPLWQEAQVPVTEVWSNWMVVQLAVLLWQLSQAPVVAMWVALLPVAMTPLWQVAQAPVITLWSKWIVVQLAVMWQVSQLAVVVMWVADLPVAVVGREAPQCDAGAAKISLALSAEPTVASWRPPGVSSYSSCLRPTDGR